MKRILFQFVALCYVLLQGCYEDKGNYDYIPLNEVKITLNPANTKGYLGERYTYSPQIEFSNPQDSVHFEYWWEARNAENGVDTVTIGRELDFVGYLVGEVELRCCVKELATGVITSNTMKVTFTSALSQGWLILGNQNGASILSYIRPGKDDDGNRLFTPFVDLYKQLYPNLQLGTNPTSLRQVFADNYEENATLVLVGQDEPLYLDGSTYTKLLDLRNEFMGGQPSNFKYKDYGWGWDLDLFLSEDGAVYVRKLEDTEVLLLTEQIPTIPLQYEGKPLKIEKLIVPPTNNAKVKALYDAENNRILWIDNTRGVSLASYYSFTEGTTLEDCVDLSNFNGWKLVHAQSGFNDQWNGGMTYTPMMFLFKKGNEMKIQTIQVYYSTSAGITLRNVEVKTFSGDQLASNAKYFFEDSRNFKNYLYIAQGNQLYWYNYARNEMKLFYELKAGDEVVDIDFNTRFDEMGVLTKSGEFIVLNHSTSALVFGELAQEKWRFSDPEIGLGVDLMYKFPDVDTYEFKIMYPD